MHKVCRLVAVVMACGFAAVSVAADPTAPAYDAQLAAKLGADGSAVAEVAANPQAITTATRRQTLCMEPPIDSVCPRSRTNQWWFRGCGRNKLSG